MNMHYPYPTCVSFCLKSITSTLHIFSYSKDMKLNIKFKNLKELRGIWDDDEDELVIIVGFSNYL